jgi:hypothetical protein
MPTGSAVRSVAHWRENLGRGKHWEGGRIEHFAHRPGELTYVDADLTRAYDNAVHDSQGGAGRVRRVRRELLYLHDEDRLIVHDEVVAVRPQYTKKWLLHLVKRPQIPGLRRLAGTAEAGIFETDAARVLVQNADARLAVRRVYPDDAIIRLVGGPGYQYYVESDGDDSDLDGENFAAGAKLAGWFDLGLWRIEIQPGAPRRVDHFLVALSPSIGRARDAAVVPVPLERGEGHALATDEAIIVFADPRASAPLAFDLPARQRRVLLVGTAATDTLTLTRGQARVRRPVGGTPIAVLAIPADPSTRVRLSW